MYCPKVKKLGFVQVSQPSNIKTTSSQLLHSKHFISLDRTFFRRSTRREERPFFGARPSNSTPETKQENSMGKSTRRFLGDALGSGDDFVFRLGATNYAPSLGFWKVFWLKGFLKFYFQLVNMLQLLPSESPKMEVTYITPEKVTNNTHQKGHSEEPGFMFVFFRQFKCSNGASVLWNGGILIVGTSNWISTLYTLRVQDKPFGMIQRENVGTLKKSTLANVSSIFPHIAIY